MRAEGQLVTVRSRLGDGVDPDTDPTTDYHKNADGTVTYNNVTFDPRNQKTFVLGMIAGLQFTTETYGKCFYSAVDTVNFIDYIERDIQQITIDWQWFVALVYNPTHFFSNLMASYQ